MFFIIYVSSAVHPFSKPELLELLAKSRENNTQLGVTGMLLYKGGNIIQVLEGEEAVVHKLYTKIASDARHQGLIPLLQGVQTARQFPEWSMGFYDLNHVDLAAHPGYSEFLNTPLTAGEFSSDPTRCQRLLLLFKQNMR
ncbi:MAG: BLUF domain-containing protein [Chloroflexi bacterium]|nr:BLUF domain-containing protein [Chloroflexota bacterium]